MKKIVAFMGSPRKNGNTATLINEVIRGAQDAGAETTVSQRTYKRSFAVAIFSCCCKASF